MSEATMLLEHGTLLARLKASNVLQAAEADLKLREKKREKVADPAEMYSFARLHVRRARSAAHLIALAYFEPAHGLATDKHSTLVVYRDRDLLRATLRELLDVEQGDAA